MLLIVGISLVILFSIFITSLLDLKSRLSIILSWYLLGMANIVLTAEISGLFSQVNNKWFFAGIHLLFAIISISVWWIKGKPRLFPPVNKQFNFNDIFRSFKTDPLLWILAIGVTFIYLLNAYIITRFHANTNDSLAVHLARIGYWLQFGSFRPWPTENISQIIYPFNAQVQMLWTILFSGTDQLVEFVQWFGAVFGVVAITGLSQLLGYTKKQGLFAGLIWATLPMVLLQSTTTQNDLIVASVILIGVYFLFFGLINQSNRHIIMSSLAFGLSFGIKQTAFFVIPGICGAIILFYIKYKKKILKPSLIFIGSTILALLLFGSYIYINNIVYGTDVANLSGSSQTSTPFGPSAHVASNMSLDRISYIGDSIFINSGRYFFQSLDPTGIPLRFRSDFLLVRERIIRLLFDILRVPVESNRAIGLRVFSLSYDQITHEDTSWFGLLGFFLIFIVQIEVIKSIKQKDIVASSLYLIALSAYFGVLVFRNSWTPYQGRYMVTVFSCLAPFFASIYLKETDKNNIIRVFLVFLVVGFALISSRSVILHNEGKPFRMQNIILNGSRLQHYRFSGGYFSGIVEFVDEYIPEDMVLGLATGPIWEYPFFGEGLTRRLIPIYPSDRLSDEDWLLTQNVNYILLNTSFFEVTDVPLIYKPISSLETFIILKRVQ